MKQMDDMLEGFNSICDVQLYWRICESTYLKSANKKCYDELVEPLAKLYSQIIEYQARAICHLSKAQLSRAWEKVANSNDWNGMKNNIEMVSNKHKDIVPVLQQNEIRKQWEAQLQEMQESKNILMQIRQVLEETKIQNLKIYENEDEEEILKNFASDYEADKNFNPRRVEGTCEWFLGNEQFRNWRNDKKSSLLWVAAGPGCGKSVLSRALIDEKQLSTNVATSTVCYFFFKDGDKRRMDCRDALCAILHQLFKQDLSGTLIKSALQRHKNYGKTLKENFSELWKTLLDCGKSSDAGDIICLLDALDECNQGSRRQLFDSLEEFLPNRQDSRLKFLMTSRPYDDLEFSFKKFSGLSSYLRFDGDDKSDRISDEINLVIDDRLKPLTDGFAHNDREAIRERLKLARNRTYLWLYLTFESIEQKRSNRRTDIEKLLEELSQTVAEKYEKLLSRSVNPAQTEILLQIVLAAKRPLTLKEANFALTLALQNHPFTSYGALESEVWPDENFKSTVKNLCGLLISIYDSKLFFIHQTAREFLVHSDRHGNWEGRFSMPDSHTTMLGPCLSYIVIQDLVLPELPLFDVETKNEIDHLSPFLLYASEYWCMHYSEHSPEANVKAEAAFANLALQICDKTSKCYPPWTFAYDTGLHDPLPNSENPLAIIAFLGIQGLVKQVLKMGKMDLNFKDEKYERSPISLAAGRGHEAVVQLFLESDNFDLNSKDMDGHTPPMCAVINEDETIVKKMLETGRVDSATKDNQGRTLFLRAVEYGWKNVVQQLLESGEANIDIKDQEGRTPLSYAAGEGYAGVVKQLLDTGKVDVNSEDFNARTPLWYAAGQGNTEIVQQLLDTGNVNPNSKDAPGGLTPLMVAAIMGQDAVARQLLQFSQTDQDSKDDSGKTALWHALDQESDTVVKVFLEFGKVDVDRPVR